MKSAVRLLASAAAVAILSFSALAAEARPFTAKDMVTLDRIGDPRVSPDGRYVLYSLRTMDYEANKASTSLWLIDLKARDQAPRALADTAGANSARWAPDSQSIYFLASRGDAGGEI